MSNQTPDLDEVALRFGNSNTDPVLTWGVPSADVEIYRPAPAPDHPDGAIFDMTREIPRFLNNNSYPADGSFTSLIVATEQIVGEAGMDEFDDSAGGFDVNLTNYPEATMRHVRIVNLAYEGSSWRTIEDDELIDAIVGRHSDLSADLAELAVDYPDVNQTHLEKGIGLMYLQWTTGQTRLTSVDGLVIAPDSESDFDTYNRLELGFNQLGAYLLAASGLLQEGAGVAIDSPNGMWSYISSDDSDQYFSPWWLSWAWEAGRFIFNTESNKRVWYSMKAILRVILGIYLFIWAVQTLVAAVKAGVAIMKALFTGFKLANTIKSWGSWGLTIMAVVLYLGMLALTIVTAKNKYEIRWAIAIYVVAIVFTLVLALISFIPGGSIVLALLYIADAIVYFITGESFLEEAYKAIAEAFYNFEFVTSLTKARFSTMNVDLTKGNTFEEGSRLLFSNSFYGELEGTKTRPRKRC